MGRVNRDVSIVVVQAIAMPGEAFDRVTIREQGSHRVRGVLMRDTQTLRVAKADLAALIGGSPSKMSSIVYVGRSPVSA